MSYPQFFQQPLRFLRWASHEKPAIFYSFVIASGGPLSIVVAPPIRRYFNDDAPREKIPMTYPGKLTPPPHPPAVHQETARRRGIMFAGRRERDPPALFFFTAEVDRVFFWGGRG